MQLKPFSKVISYKQFKGFSSYFSIGKTKGWQINKDGPSLRIDLGWISFSFMSIDIQNLIKGLLEELREKDNKEKQVKELENQNAARLEEVNKRETEVENSQKEFILLKEKANCVDGLKKQIKEHETKIDDLSAEINDNEAEIDDILADKDTYTEEIEDLKEIKAKLEKELQETKEIYNEQIEENKRLMALLVESSSSSSSSSSSLFSSSSSSSSSL